jgi:hypothetical protein
MRGLAKRSTAAVLAALAAVAVQAAGQVQFSAEMVRQAPDGKTATGHMYVGDGRTRMEISQQGRDVVRISDQGRRMEYILFPADKTYLERQMPPAREGAPAPDAQPSAESDPCVGVPGLTCRRVGVENVNGRPAVQWEMTMTHQGQTLTGAQWLDVERGIALKHRMPNGQAMELKMVGTETLGGRQVEKWEMTTTAPKQPPTATFQWYDPELKLAVRDQLPGGYTSELKGIQVGPQPDSLFAVPEGYTRMTAPPAGAAPPQSAQ